MCCCGSVNLLLCNYISAIVYDHVRIAEDHVRIIGDYVRIIEGHIRILEDQIIAWSGCQLNLLL